MRVEPHTIGSYMHIIKRGARGMEIVKDDADYWRFIKSLFYLNNNNYRKENWEIELRELGTPLFSWPDSWPKQDKLVEIVAFIIMPNHFHLLVKEIVDGGISIFMQGLGISMTMSFNEKYDEVGSIFQGSYKGKTIDSDEYLKRTAVYIMVKNSFELYPGGIESAMNNFEKAWEYSLKNPFSSLADYGCMRNSPIISKNLLGKLFKTPTDFKKFAKDTMLGRNLENMK